MSSPSVMTNRGTRSISTALVVSPSVIPHRSVQAVLVRDQHDLSRSSRMPMCRAEKGRVLALPGPAIDHDRQDVQAEKPQQAVEPERAVDEVLRGGRVVKGFDEGRGGQGGRPRPRMTKTANFQRRGKGLPRHQRLNFRQQVELERSQLAPDPVEVSPPTDRAGRRPFSILPVGQNARGRACPSAGCLPAPSRRRRGRRAFSAGRSRRCGRPRPSPSGGACGRRTCPAGCRGR